MVKGVSKQTIERKDPSVVPTRQVMAAAQPQHTGAVFSFIGSGVPMRVERRDGETVEQLIRRFNKGVVSERITKTYREKMHFVSKSEQRKEKRRRAERNRRKKMTKIL